MAIEASRQFDGVLRTRGLDAVMNSCLTTLLAAAVVVGGHNASLLEQLNLHALTAPLAAGGKPANELRTLAAAAVSDVAPHVTHALLLGTIGAVLPSAADIASATRRQRARHLLAKVNAAPSVGGGGSAGGGKRQEQGESEQEATHVGGARRRR